MMIWKTYLLGVASSQEIDNTTTSANTLLTTSVASSQEVYNTTSANTLLTTIVILSFVL